LSPSPSLRTVQAGLRRTALRSMVPLQEDWQFRTCAVAKEYHPRSVKRACAPLQPCLLQGCSPHHKPTDISGFFNGLPGRTLGSAGSGQPGRAERRAAAAIAFNGAGGAEAAPPDGTGARLRCAGLAARFAWSPRRGCCDVRPTLPLPARAGNALSSSIRPSRLPSFERSRRGAGKNRFEPSASVERNVPAGNGVASRHDAGIPCLVLNRLRFLVRARTREHAAPVCHSAARPARAGDSRQLPLGSSWQRVRFASERPGF